MSLGETLAQKRKTAIEDSALRFAKNIQEELYKSADQGNSDFYVEIDTNQEGLVTAPEYIKALELLLEGVTVEIVQKHIFLSVTKKYLKFSW